MEIRNYLTSRIGADDGPYHFAIERVDDRRISVITINLTQRVCLRGEHDVYCVCTDGCVVDPLVTGVSLGDLCIVR
mgnify:CR=1 FL=1